MSDRSRSRSERPPSNKSGSNKSGSNREKSSGRARSQASSGRKEEAARSASRKPSSRKPSVVKDEKPSASPRRRSPPKETGVRGPGGLRVWVGGLPRDVKEDEVRSAFEKFGKIVDIRLKMQVREPPFAFVEFEKRADAEDAIVEMNQCAKFGDPIKVQAEKGAPAPRKLADRHTGAGGGRRGSNRRRDSRRRDSRRRGGGRKDSRGGGDRRGGGYDRGNDRGGGNDRSVIPLGRYKITLENLPHDMSWTELKELGRAQSEHPSEVTFARTFQVRGTQCGLLEFKDEKDAQRVVDKLDGRKIKGHNDRIKVCMGTKKF